MPVDATILQDNTGFAAGGVTTYAVTLSAATAGNCLVFIGAGDKDITTWTPSGPLSTVYFLHGGAGNANQVSLVIAFGTAVGGETSVGGTVGANLGGANLWAAELEQDGSGAWTVMASASNHSDGTAVLVWPTGTTGSATGNGLALAAVSCDSVNTAGTASWSDSYVVEYSSGNGSTQAGLWVASKSITSGNTTGSTLTRTGTTDSDQHSGAVVVVGRAAGGTNASAGAATVSMAGQDAAVETFLPNAAPTVAAVAMAAQDAVVNYSSAPSVGSAAVGMAANDATVKIAPQVEVAEFNMRARDIVVVQSIACAFFEASVIVDRHSCEVVLDAHSGSVALEAHTTDVGVEAHYGEVAVCGRE